jgi:penicillin V acylase-like amidase (Ntn superfamily)
MSTEQTHKSKQRTFITTTTHPRGQVVVGHNGFDHWFPTTPDGHDGIMGAVDRFTKMAHFIPTFKKSTTQEIAMLFFKEVIRIHGLPREIILDKDIKFMSPFWKTIQDCTRTELKFSTTDLKLKSLSCSKPILPQLTSSVAFVIF